MDEWVLVYSTKAASFFSFRANSNCSIRSCYCRTHPQKGNNDFVLHDYDGNPHRPRLGIRKDQKKWKYHFQISAFWLAIGLEIWKIFNFCLHPAYHFDSHTHWPDQWSILWVSASTFGTFTTRQTTRVKLSNYLQPLNWAGYVPKCGLQLVIRFTYHFLMIITADQSQFTLTSTTALEGINSASHL